MEGPVSEGEPKKPRKFAEVFDEAFPSYLAMGMTYEQFWEMDCDLVIPYRKAFKIRQEQKNHDAWLQGLYIYEALCDVSPVLHAFAKSGTTVHPYPEKPFELKDASKKEAKVSEDEQKMQNAVAFMQRMTAQFNKQFRERKKENAPERRVTDDA